MLPLIDLDRYVVTRRSLHAVAEHVLCAARYAAVGRIGLRAAPGGFATPYFGDHRRVLVVGTRIGDEHHDECDHEDLTTLRAAAAFVDVEPGAPTAVFSPSTPCDLDAPLRIDHRDAATIAEWFAFGDAALRVWRTTNLELEPSRVQLWPEHFDLACDLGDPQRSTRANYGFSPGDDTIAEPYVYIGPWDPEARVDDFWDQPWGASLRRSQVEAGVRSRRTPETIVQEFFRAGLDRLTNP
jgi:hypothetical protein